MTEKECHKIYTKYCGRLTAVCSRYLSNEEDVKDVLQDSFLKIFRNIDDFTARTDGSLEAWMKRIVVNESLNFLRKRKHLVFMDNINDISSEDVAETDIGGVPFDVILNLIRQLPDGFRTVFNLFVFEQRSHKEIAELLGIKENTSASQFFRAKKMLIEKVEKYKLQTDE
ncbi:MAG: sigma-70 family RNA polymerase sigma factor [Bacteroidaceae bacterium]|nr:sigma-70 family RNA polymerase sigma factor [Bacteroidaceae bacterium]